MDIPKLTPDDRLLAVMGITGVGKSSFIQLFTNENVGIGEDLESFTTQIAVFPCMLPESGEKFYLVDTPGFDDSNKTDHEILRELSSWLTKTYSENIKLSGIIYLHRIMDVRLGGAALRNLRMFKKLCGDGKLASVVLATTFWSTVDEATGKLREAQLMTTPTFWGTMVGQGSKVLRHDSDAKSGTAIIKYLLGRQEQVVYAIQDEMVNKKKTLDETAAGTEVQTEMDKMRRKYEQDLLDLQKEMNEALQKQDEVTRKELEKERKERQQWIERELQERKKMQADADELWKQREREREQERQEHYQRMEELQRQFSEMESKARIAEADKQYQLERAQIQKALEIERIKVEQLERARFSLRAIMKDFTEFVKNL